MLLDDVRLTFLDTVEPVGDVKPVSYLLGVRVDEIELVESANHADINAAVSAAPVRSPQAPRNERAKLHVRGKARLEGRFILCRDRVYELGAE